MLDIQVAPAQPIDPRRARYLKYLCSEHWEALRRKSFALYGKKCVVCGNPHVDGHHLIYRRLTNVRPNEVIPLCREHHDEIHRAEDSGALGHVYLSKAPKAKLAALSKFFGLNGDTLLTFERFIEETPTPEKFPQTPHPKVHRNHQSRKARKAAKFFKKLVQKRTNHIEKNDRKRLKKARELRIERIQFYENTANWELPGGYEEWQAKAIIPTLNGSYWMEFNTPPVFSLKMVKTDRDSWIITPRCCN